MRVYAERGSRSEGLPGNYKAGFYYHSGVTREFLRDKNNNSYIISGLDPAKHIGNYNFYCHADQMIYRENGPGTDQGITVFGVATFGPDNINKYPFFFNGGISWKGCIPGRDNDIAASGMSYGLFSYDLRRAQADMRDIKGLPAEQDPQEYEIMIELTYRAMILPYFYIQPDIQYILHPGGTADYPDAFVMGVRVGVTF
ncbi:MAG: carbohydrate porin [Candidatus Omnitrophota bacterium]